MTREEARKTLWLYRGAIDEDDPQFQEALAYARRDPELTRWLEEQRKCFEAIRSRFREIEPPHGLSGKITSRRPVPFPRDLNRILQLAAAILLSAVITAVALKLSERKSESVARATEVVVTGEVLDMTCYIAYHLSGPEHAECARVCIKNGMPVGIKGENGKVYLLTGEPGHSINGELADYAAKTVTIKGKETARDGFAQLQVKEIRKS